MRILTKPKDIDSIISNIDMSSAVRAFLSFDEPEGISSLRKDEASLMAELIKYDYEMKQNGYLNHNAIRNLIKHKTALEWIYSNPSMKRKTALLMPFERLILMRIFYAHIAVCHLAERWTITTVKHYCHSFLFARKFNSMLW